MGVNLDWYSKSYFIAEIGVNHEGSLDLALEMCRTASLAGADAVKFQIYKADTITAKDSPSYWDVTKEEESSQYKLFLKHQMYSLDFYLPIINLCNELGLDFLASCFDPELLTIFSPYLSRIKVSSSDLTNYQLLKAVALLNKPIILSTGASTFTEIEQSVEFIKQFTSAHITLLHCVLNYPCALENANISMIKQLMDSKITDTVGYSCHVPCPDGIQACMFAIASGAKVIEKHFTTSRIKVGNDHYHAMTPEDLSIFRSLESKYILSMGSPSADLCNQEQARSNARRGVYASKTIKRGEIITEEHLMALRPAKGALPANLFFEVVGKESNTDISQGDAICLDYFS